jgi:hypothetical protein
LLAGGALAGFGLRKQPLPVTPRSTRQHVPWGFPLGHRRDAEQIGHRLTGLVAAAKLFGVIGDADRVLGKGPAMEMK